MDGEVDDSGDVMEDMRSDVVLDTGCDTLLASKEAQDLRPPRSDMSVSNRARASCLMRSVYGTEGSAIRDRGVNTACK